METNQTHSHLYVDINFSLLCLMESAFAGIKYNFSQILSSNMNLPSFVYPMNPFPTD